MCDEDTPCFDRLIEAEPPLRHDGRNHRPGITNDVDILALWKQSVDGRQRLRILVAVGVLGILVAPPLTRHGPRSRYICSTTPGTCRHRLSSDLVTRSGQKTTCTRPNVEHPAEQEHHPRLVGEEYLRVMVEHLGEEGGAGSGRADHPERGQHQFAVCLSSIHSYSVPVRSSAISSKFVRSEVRGAAPVRPRSRLDVFGRDADQITDLPVCHRRIVLHVLLIDQVQH